MYTHLFTHQQQQEQHTRIDLYILPSKCSIFDECVDIPPDKHLICFRHIIIELRFALHALEHWTEHMSFMVIYIERRWIIV